MITKYQDEKEMLILVNTEVGDRIVIMNPWTLRLSLLIVFIFGVAIGIVISYFSALHAIEIIGSSFKVENANITVQLNQSMILEAMQEAVNRSTHA